MITTGLRGRHGAPRRFAGRQRGRAVSYFAKVGRPGPISYHYLPGTIDVFGGPAAREPIGFAHCTNWGDDGPATWRLIIDGRPVEATSILVDREFRPASDVDRQ